VGLLCKEEEIYRSRTESHRYNGKSHPFTLDYTQSSSLPICLCQRLSTRLIYQCFDKYVRLNRVHHAQNVTVCIINPQSRQSVSVNNKLSLPFATVIILQNYPALSANLIDGEICYFTVVFENKPHFTKKIHGEHFKIQKKFQRPYWPLFQVLYNR